MKGIRMSIVSVCNDKGTKDYFLMKELQKMLNNTDFYLLTNIEIYRSMIVQNVDQLEKEIISTVDLNTTDIVLIFGLTSMKNDITKKFTKARKEMRSDIIRKIIKVREDTEDVIGRLFAKIPALIWPIKDKSVYLSATCQNNTFIFIMTGTKRKLSIYMQKAADSILLSAYLLQLTVKYYNRNILNHPGVEQDEVSNTQHSDSSSMDMSDLFDSSEHESISPVYQEICHYKVSITDAWLLIIQTLSEHIMLESEFVQIKSSLHRILTQSVPCFINAPSFPVVTQQKYVSSEINPVNLDHDTRLQVDKEEHIPLGATAITSAENIVSPYDETELIKSMSHTIEYEKNVKFLGSNIERGKLIIEKYTCIGSKELTHLVASGYTHVKVLRKLSVGILTIGNKLQEPGQPLEPEHSYDCNRIFLISLLKENGINCSIKDFGIINDDTISIILNIKAALKTVDLLVTSGCSGDENSLNFLLKMSFSATLHFEQVNIKPGTRTIFASCYFENKSKIILCLPGNPSGFFVSAYIFFLPLVNWIHGIMKENATISAKLEQKLPLHYRSKCVWVTLSWSKEDHLAKVTCKNKNSINDNLSDTIGANAFLRLPPKTPKISTLEAPIIIPANFLL